ncbi:zinc finger protein 131-like isoform X1 [Diabrotica virgifera virgifera]|uniref:Zinc finger protein 131-like isoform X1 n=1 Tax=Diabrotica virgifera virgifera TaxID=50390 RepID=A0A6P7F3E8_DIAVI|nr:zinc finger protein 131-like isoform X1 [Diabrotica virgifera virgifera]
MNSMDEAKQFAVTWSNHMNHVKQAFDNLLNNSDLTDVTLYVEGNKIGAHKMLLSACSNYFNNLFKDFPQEHPIIVLKGVRCRVLKDILKFIYSGEVSVDSSHFDNFLQTAEFLEISGLTNRQNVEECENVDTELINGSSSKSKRIRSRKKKIKMEVTEEGEADDGNAEWDDQDLTPVFTENLCDIQITQGSDEIEVNDIVVKNKRKIDEEDQQDLSSDDSVAGPNCTPKVEGHVQISVSSCSSAPTKSSRKSKFDNFFDIANDRQSAMCKLCFSEKKKIMKLSMSHRSTSGLSKHLRRAHRDEFNLLAENMVPDRFPSAD